MSRECRRFEIDALRAIDGELDFAREDALRNHAAACASCAAHWSRLRKLEEGLVALPRPRWSDDGVRACIDRALQDVDQRVAPTKDRAPVRVLLLAATLVVGIGVGTFIVRSDSPKPADSEVSTNAVDETVHGTDLEEQSGPANDQPENGGPTDSATPSSRNVELVLGGEWEDIARAARARQEELSERIIATSPFDLIPPSRQARAQLAEDAVALTAVGDPIVRAGAYEVLAELVRQGTRLSLTMQRAVSRGLQQEVAPPALTVLLEQVSVSSDLWWRAAEHPSLRSWVCVRLAASAELDPGLLQRRLLIPLLRSDTEADAVLLDRVLAALPGERAETLDHAAVLYREGLPSVQLAPLLKRLQGPAIAFWADGLDRGVVLPDEVSASLAEIVPRSEFIPVAERRLRDGTDIARWARLLARLPTHGGWRTILEFADDRGHSHARREEAYRVLVHEMGEANEADVVAAALGLGSDVGIVALLLEGWDEARRTDVDLAATVLQDRRFETPARQVAARVLGRRAKLPTEAYLASVTGAHEGEDLLLVATVLVEWVREGGEEALREGLDALGALERSSSGAELSRSLRHLARQTTPSDASLEEVTALLGAL